MSMLAERKRKEKWHLFPLNNDWVKDTNKFGQKMLEKMGWTPGKGLGVKEQGITEAIRPKVNATQKGLGYKFDPSTVWLEHQGNFSSLLSELNSSNSINPDQSHHLSSLEEKSRNFKKRVHYHKFARGKDLSRCNQKDLSSIFGGVPHMITEPEEIRVITNFQSSETADEKKNLIGSSLVEENFITEEVDETISYSNKGSGDEKLKKEKNNTKSNYLGFVKEDIEEPLDDVLSSVTDILEVSCDTFNEIGKNSYSLEDSKSLKKKKKKRKILNNDDLVYANTSSLNSEVLQVDNSTYHNKNSIIKYDSSDFNASEVPQKKRKKSKKKIIVEQNSDDVIDDCSLKSYNNNGCESKSDKKYKKRKKIK